MSLLRRRRTCTFAGSSIALDLLSLSRLIEKSVNLLDIFQESIRKNDFNQK